MNTSFFYINILLRFVTDKNAQHFYHIIKLAFYARKYYISARHFSDNIQLFMIDSKKERQYGNQYFLLYDKFVSISEKPRKTERFDRFNAYRHNLYLR